MTLSSLRCPFYTSAWHLKYWTAAGFSLSAVNLEDSQSWIKLKKDAELKYTRKLTLTYTPTTLQEH